jgi:hypothetical protein
VNDVVAIEGLTKSFGTTQALAAAVSAAGLAGVRRRDLG